MGRAERITRCLKSYDRELYCADSGEGKLCVYRNSTRWETYWFDGAWFRFARPAPFFIFALTDNWKLSGRAVDWSTDLILKRLRDGDLQRFDAVKKLRDQAEEEERAKAKSFESKAQDLFREIRPRFKKETADINTSVIRKKDRRTLDDKKIKQRF